MLDSHYSFQNSICMTVWLYVIFVLFANSEFFTKQNGFADTFQRSPVEAREESTKSTTKLRSSNRQKQRTKKRRNDRFKGNLEDCLGLRVSQNLFGKWDLFKLISLFWLCLIHRDWIWYKARVKSFDMVAKLLRTQWWVRRGDDQFGASLSLPFLTRPVHTLVYDDGEDAKLLPGSYPKYEFVDVLLIV